MSFESIKNTLRKNVNILDNVLSKKSEKHVAVIGVKENRMCVSREPTIHRAVFDLRPALKTDPHSDCVKTKGHIHR